MTDSKQRPASTTSAVAKRDGASSVKKKNTNRIPSSNSDQWTSWTLPVIGDDGQVLSADKRTARSHESIEDVELDHLPGDRALTAEQLAQIVSDAEKEGFATGKDEGFKLGYDDGFKSGQQQGALEMRQQLLAEQKTFQGIAQSLLEPVSQQDDMLESLLLTSIQRLAKAVVMRELTVNSGDILALTREAIAALPAGREHLTVHLNPDDLLLVEAYCKEHALEWKFHPDPDMTVGGVKVETANSTVDFSIERRLTEVLERFVTQQQLDETTSDEQLLAAQADATAGSEEPAAAPSDGADTELNFATESEAPDDSTEGRSAGADIDGSGADDEDTNDR